MTALRTAEILRHLEPDAVADSELLARFLHRDEAAFEALVRRHGPLILSVCRRIARHEQDAEDAFQAVFLILAKKAAAIRNPDLLGNWLHGIAIRVAQRARRGAHRRRRREVQAVNLPEPAARVENADAEVGRLLHEELGKLSGIYREAILLCDLRGVSRAEAAKILGIAEGTVSSRLAAGRKRLAERLARRGIALAAAAVPTALADASAVGVLPDSLVAKTCALVANWQAGTTIPAAILRLTRGGFPMRSMLLASVAGMTLTAAGLVLASGSDDPPQPNNPPKEQTETKAAPNTNEEAKTIAYGVPRLQKAMNLDLTLRPESRIVWSPDGKRLAIHGQQGLPLSVAQVNVYSVAGFNVVEDETRSFGLDAKERLVGVTREGAVITELREYGLVSGFHRLTLWKPEKPSREILKKAGVDEADAAVAMQPARSVDLDSDHSFGFAFSPDGKSYRTVVKERIDGDRVKLSVREISMETGKALRTVFQIEGEFRNFQLCSDGSHLAAVQGDEAFVFEIATGRKAFQKLELDPKWNPTFKTLSSTGVAFSKKPEIQVELSPDGSVALLRRGIGRPVLINSNGQKKAPLLEGKEMLGTGDLDRQAFSHDSRLVAASGQRCVMQEQERNNKKQNTISALEMVINVWDTETGKLVKSWTLGRDQVLFAFHPTKPILAVVEPHTNYERTSRLIRLGLWDFSAEMPKNSER